MTKKYIPKTTWRTRQMIEFQNVEYTTEKRTNWWQGQDSRDRVIGPGQSGPKKPGAAPDSRGRTARTDRPGQFSWDWPGRPSKPGQDILYSKAGTGQSRKVSQDKTVWMEPGQLDKTVRTVLPDNAGQNSTSKFLYIKCWSWNKSYNYSLIPITVSPSLTPMGEIGYVHPS